MTKYAIKVPVDDDSDDMLFVTEGDTKFQLRIKTFDTVSEAWEHAYEWGPHCLVVELDDDFEILL